jgi:uncharacterized protein (TIGR04255 family)
MTIDEVFPNPTVRKVIFQIRFPALFAMESLVGDLQVRIMDEFPDSRLVQQMQIVLAQTGPEGALEQLPEEPRPGSVTKIWRFESESGTVLNVLPGSLDLTSQVHKTYNNPDGDIRFRDAIQLAVDNLLEVTRIPKLLRVGLRYIDECPVPDGGQAAFRDYYKTTFPLDRFGLEDAIEMQLIARVRRRGHFLTFREALKGGNGKANLTLDFDAYAENVKAAEYLAVSDQLHEIVSAEFEASIKEPVYVYMRRQEE